MSRKHKRKNTSKLKSRSARSVGFNSTYLVPALLIITVLIVGAMVANYRLIIHSVPEATSSLEQEIAVSKIASKLEGKLETIRMLVLEQSKRPEILEYFNNPTEAAKVLNNIQAKLPFVTGIRLLPDAPLSRNENIKPPIGYAAIELVKRTREQSKASEFELHFSGKEYEHLVLNVPILDGNNFVGHFYVMLSAQLLRESLAENSSIPADSYIELSQYVNEQLQPVLAARGPERLKIGNPKVRHYIDDSRFAVSLWTPKISPWKVRMNKDTLLFGLIQGGTLVMLLLSCALIMLRIRHAIREDLATLMNMFEQLQLSNFKQHFHFKLTFFQGAADALSQQYHPGPSVQPESLQNDSFSSPPLADTGAFKPAKEPTQPESSPIAQAPEIPLPPPLSKSQSEELQEPADPFDLNSAPIESEQSSSETSQAEESTEENWVLDFPHSSLDDDELAALGEDPEADTEVSHEEASQQETERDTETLTSPKQDENELSLEELAALASEDPQEFTLELETEKGPIELSDPENANAQQEQLAQINETDASPSLTTEDYDLPLEQPMEFDLTNEDMDGTQEPAVYEITEPQQEESEPDMVTTTEPSEAQATAAADKVPKAIFRTYDIRGIVATDLTPDVVYLIGLAFGSEARKQQQDTVIVARDGRTSSPKLVEQLSKGLTEAGCNVIDIGLCPTPILYFATNTLESNTGIMITGSHNPKEYNGLKMVLNGQTLSGDQVLALRTRIQAGDFTSGTGKISYDDEVLPNYLKRVAGDIDLPKNLKIVVDAGNGATANIAPILFRTLGCHVAELYCEVDGNFPNHHPDPSQPENLEDLIRAVREKEADIGLAFDGDGDRLGIVAPNGEIIWPDRQMMLFAMDILSRNPGASIIYDVKCSKHLSRIIEEHEGVPIMWKTGHSLIKNKLRESGALLAGEMSGHIFFKERWYGFDDALYSAARLLEIIARDPRDAADIFAALPNSTNTPELKIDMNEGQNYSFMDLLMNDASFEDGEKITIDGLRVEFSDGWGLVRASNTTPSVVLRFEADDEESLKRIQELFREQILKIDAHLTLPF